MGKDHKEIRLITGSHFVWVAYDVRKKKPTSIGGGTCSLTAGNYSEVLDFADKRAEDLIGKPQSFKVRIEGDNWIQNGVLSNGLNIEENWRRIH